MTKEYCFNLLKLFPLSTALPSCSFSTFYTGLQVYYQCLLTVNIYILNSPHKNEYAIRPMNSVSADIHRLTLLHLSSQHDMPALRLTLKELNNGLILTVLSV
jgi:hypothetical protein